MKALSAALAVLLALAGCAKPPAPVHPALWEVTGPGGARGWLFGTIHALPRAVDWRSPALTAALSQADRIVVETRDVGDPAAIQRVFAQFAATPNLPRLSARIEPPLRPALARLLAKAGYTDTQFASTETWAAALMLARAASPELDGGFGIDRALLAAAPGKPVAELEGTTAQLALFDRLAEADQRDLLAATVRGEAGEEPDLVAAWGTGDIAAIGRATTTGLLADPELREALLTGRNRAWAGKVTALLKSGAHPFVAAGGAHMAGPDGLPALLAAGGYAVRRVQ